MKLPRYTAKVGPPRFAGAARATDIGALTRTGEVEVWRGVSQLGGGMKDVSNLMFRVQQDRQAIDARLQHNRVSSSMAEYANELDRSLEEQVVTSKKHRDDLQQANMALYDKEFQNQLKTVDNHKALQALKISQYESKARASTQIYNKLTANYDRYQVNAGLEEVNKQIAAGNAEEAIEQIEFMVAHKQLTPIQGDSRIKAVPKLIRIARRDAAEEMAKAILVKDGLPAAQAFVASLPTDIVPIDDQAKIITGLESIAKVMRRQIGLEVEANNKAAVIDLFGRLGDFTAWPTEKEIRDSTALLEKESWREIVVGLGNEEEPETDYKDFIDFETKLFDRWRGLDRSVDRTGKEPVESEVLLETEIASFRHTERKINDQDMKELTRRLGLSLGRYTDDVESAFEEIRKMGKVSPGIIGVTLGALYLSQSEAKNIATARKNLLDWVIEQSAKGVDIKSSKITEMAREFIVSTRSAKPAIEVPKEVPEEAPAEPPTILRSYLHPVITDEDYEKVPSGAFYRDPEGVLRKKR